MIRPNPLLKIDVAEKLASLLIPTPPSPNLRITSEKVNHSISQTATYFFNSLLSCSLSRGSAQFFTPPPRIAPIVSAHSRRQDPKTPVEQALMRGLGTA
jgi:hypothetical protein